MRILIVPSSTLESINSKSTQVAAMTNVIAKIAMTDVITNCADMSTLSKIGFSPQVEFEYVSECNAIDTYKKIIKLNNEQGYDYIVVSNIKVLELMYTVNPQLLETKVVSSIMTECSDLDFMIKVLNKSKSVHLPSQSALKYYQSRGLNNSNLFVKLPFVNYVADENIKKIFDMIFVGEISDDNQAYDFFRIVSRYPKRKFAIVYNEFSNKLTYAEEDFINYGLNNFTNLEVYNNISNTETLDLIAQSKYTFALKTTVIETENTIIPASKVIEGMATHTYPLVKKVQLNEELLGSDYQCYIEDIECFRFAETDERFEIHYENLVNSTVNEEQLKQQFQKQQKDKPVFINQIPSLTTTLNLFDLNIEIATNNVEVYKYCKQFGIKQTKVEKLDTENHRVLADVESEFTDFHACENTIILPPALIQKLELHGIYLRDYKFIDESKTSLQIKQLNTLANTNFHFTVNTKRELLGVMNIVGNLECDFINFNIVTTFKNECITTKAMSFNKKITNSIELELKNYNESDLFKIAIGEKVNCEEYKVSDLVIVNNLYPSYENIYAHAYVHTRTKLYKKQGVNPIVVVLSYVIAPIETYVYDNQMVIKCSREGFEFLFGNDNDFVYGIHFLNESIYNALNYVSRPNKKVVWFHGSDSLPASLRAEFYDLHRKDAYEAYSLRGKTMKKQDKVLKRIFANPTYQSVFVSNWLKTQISERYELDEEHVAVIPNSIDTSTFFYEPKSVKEDERIKFLSIKPFLLEYDIYANQVLVDAIKLASQQSWFNKCEFTIYGRGDGFNYYMNQLDQLNCDNIKYHETFLSHAQIKALHSSHHVFLQPVNQDTHGVSFFEAMSSGLVSINSENSAKPEYCTSGVTGFLHKDQDAEDLCKVMAEVVQNYNELDHMREAGNQSVIDQFGEETITEQELNILFRDYNLLGK